MVAALRRRRRRRSRIMIRCFYSRNFLRVAIRSLFPETLFDDKSVAALEMKIKKLMPMDAESRRLIDWMEKGVYDTLQKKYLKTLLFCICEEEGGTVIEEFSFSFSYRKTNSEEDTMCMSCRVSKKSSTTFKSNAAEVTPDLMRRSACKMIRTLLSLMRTLDPTQEERTILMKLLYYDDVTPEDYEPPFLKCCAGNEGINIWSKNPLKMEVGNVNSKHLVLALKVKSVHDPCNDNNANSGDDGMGLDNESEQNDDFSDTEVRPSEADRYIVAPNDGNLREHGTISEDDTQDAAHEEELTAQVREWICSRDIGTINVSDVLSNFPDISMELVEGNAAKWFCVLIGLILQNSEILNKLFQDCVLSRAGKDGYTINKPADPKTPHKPAGGTKTSSADLMYMKALYHVLSVNYVTIAKLQGKLDGQAKRNTVRKLIEKMVQDGYVKNSTNRGLGRAVIHSEATNRKLLEIKGMLKSNGCEPMAIDTNADRANFERKDVLTGDLTCSLDPPTKFIDEDPSRAPATLHELQPSSLHMLRASSAATSKPVHNYVKWSLSGTAKEVQENHEVCSGHFRLWHYVNGCRLNAEELYGPGKILYTTALDSTFHYGVECEDLSTGELDSTTFTIDGREAWCYGFENQYGFFEFNHARIPYMYGARNWKMLNFGGAYYVEELTPMGLENMELGLESVRKACKVASRYRGEIPAPKEVQIACGILIAYTCIISKLPVPS
ncbi:hypothetical protein ACP70R_022367 [Stipagrostis hirtigluma subsp. patula]